MIWVGLTGGLASGKSSVARLLVDQGFPVIDADQVARDVLEPGEPGFDQVCAEFGKHLLNSEGRIDRAKLANEVFSDRDQLAKLERIVHPRVKERVSQIRAQLTSQGNKLAIYDVPLLFEKKMTGEFDKIIVVTCDRNQQIERAMKRNNWSKEQVEKILSSQTSLEEKVVQADFVIDNSSLWGKTVQQVLDLVNRLNVHHAQT